MLKRLVSTMLVVCIMFSFVVMTDFSVETATAATVSVGDTSYNLADNVQDGQILQCFNWSFNNIKNNMAKIAQQGFSAIQTSPIQATKESTKESWSTCSNSFWVYYQPINFSIETNSRSALGTKAEFKAMCAEAHKYGIKVIVDTVFNHLANDNAGNTLNSQIPSDIRNDSSCWHSVTNNISNYSDRYDITHNCLSGLPDLNTGSSKVQNYAISFLKECIDAGADGFRFDAVKHIETPKDRSGVSSNFWPNVLSSATSYAKSTRSITPYYYGEMLDNTGGVDISGYTDYMSVTDNGGSNDIRNAVNSSNASGAANSYIYNGAQPKKTVQWNESHDTYCEGSSSYVSDTNLKKAWAMVGARAEVCGLYLARPSSGSTKLGNADVTAWADKEVKAINEFKNAFVGQSEYFASSGSIAYNERGTSGVVMVNVSGGSTSVSVTANRMANGTYKDAISGNTFTVSNGKISGKIGSSGIAVVYDQSSVVVPSTSTESETQVETQPVSGNTRTVYVGVIEYITDHIPTVHYWDNSGLIGDATLVATGESVNFSVGSSYWSDSQQKFNIYKAEIPVEATGMKTYEYASNSKWAFEDIVIADGKITLLFEWSGVYHNVTKDYVVEEPTQAPTQAPTEAPTQAPTEPETQEPTEDTNTESGVTKTVYVGVIKYISDEVTIRYYNNNNFYGNAKLTALNKTAEFSVGSNYWSNKAKTFHLYKAEVPVEAEKIMTYDEPTNSHWSNESIELSTMDGKILLVFEWGGVYHNITADFVVASTQPTLNPASYDVQTITGEAGLVDASISWGAVDGVTKYWIYKAWDENGPFYCYDATTSTNYTVRRLQAATDYYFKVVTVRNENSESIFSKLSDAPTLHIQTQEAQKITVSIDNVDSTSISFSWPQFEDAQKYWIKFSNTTKNTNLKEEWVTYASVDASVTSYTINGRKPNTPYYITIEVEYPDPQTGKEFANYISADTKTWYSNENFFTFKKQSNGGLVVTWPEDVNASKSWMYVYDKNGKLVVSNASTTNSMSFSFAYDWESCTFALKTMDADSTGRLITPELGWAYR